MNLELVTLRSATVRLEPLSSAHVPALVDLALAYPSVFTHIPYPMKSRDDVCKAIDYARCLQADGRAIVFVTRTTDTEELCGSTSIRAVDPALPSVEIGATWLIPPRQRTAVNTSAKLLQLEHAFEALRVERVVFRTDVRNSRSQKAIARLGARREGVLRAEMRRADGSLRDSVYYSILRSEWPEVRQRLMNLQAAWPQALVAT